MARAYVARDEFAKAAKDGHAPSDAVLRKQFICDSIKAEGKTKTRQFVVSTAAVDRDNDVISPKGWQLDNYRKNPVVLFAHDYTSLPIGKCVDIKMAGGQLIATTEFADHEMASTVLRLVDGGFLNATSVGFRPVKYQLNDQRRGVDFEEQELLEFSIVPVPANPEALIVSREIYADVALLKAWAKQTLDVLAAVKAPSSPEPPPQGQEPKPAPPSSSPIDTTKPPKNDDDDDSAEKNPKPPPPPVISDNADVPNDNAPGSSKPGVHASDAEDDPKGKATEIALMVVRILKGGCSCTSSADHDAASCKCCMGKSCECTACMKVESGAVEKRGRVLNARNEAKIRAAHGHLDDVLAALPKDDSPDDGDVDEASSTAIETKDLKEVVIDLDAMTDDDELIDVSAEDMRLIFAGAINETVRSTVRDIVRTETQSAFNRARGRLD